MEGSLYGRVTLAPELQVSEPDPWVRQPSSSEDDEEVAVSGNMATTLVIRGGGERLKSVIDSDAVVDIFGAAVPNLMTHQFRSWPFQMARCLRLNSSVDGSALLHEGRSAVLPIHDPKVAMNHLYDPNLGPATRRAGCEVTL